MPTPIEETFPVNAPLLKDIDPPRNAFVLPQHKMVYMPVTKVACSSLRWMVADLGGEDFTRFYRAAGSHQSRLMTIHSNHVTWELVPRLDTIGADLLAEISPDNGWFVFAVIRDPWRRLWSAWQSKFLVHHTPYVREYGNEPWFPRIPTKPSDILDDWHTFVETAPWRVSPLRQDPHFRNQMASVRPASINYTKIYDLHDMPTLVADIHKHLRDLGLDQELYLPRANENPVPMTAEALTPEIAELICRWYKRDFAEWGDRWSLDKIKLEPGPLTMDAVNAVGYHAAANERIGDLSQELRNARTRIQELEKPRKAPAAAAPAAAPAAARPAPATLRTLARRVKRRIQRMRSATR